MAVGRRQCGGGSVAAAVRRQQCGGSAVAVQWQCGSSAAAIAWCWYDCITVERTSPLTFFLSKGLMFQVWDPLDNWLLWKHSLLFIYFIWLKKIQNQTGIQNLTGILSAGFRNSRIQLDFCVTWQQWLEKGLLTTWFRNSRLNMEFLVLAFINQ